MSVKKPGDHEKLYDFTPEEEVLSRAVEYAQKTVGSLKNVDPTMPWYFPLWLSYFYDYYRIYGDGDSKELTDAIIECQDEAEELRLRAGLPWELEYNDDEESTEEEQLNMWQRRGRMFLRAIERLSPASRRKKLSDEEQE